MDSGLGLVVTTPISNVQTPGENCSSVLTLTNEFSIKVVEGIRSTVLRLGWVPVIVIDYFLDSTLVSVVTMEVLCNTKSHTITYCAKIKD